MPGALQINMQSCNITVLPSCLGPHAGLRVVDAAGERLLYEVHLVLNDVQGPVLYHFCNRLVVLPVVHIRIHSIIFSCEAVNRTDRVASLTLLHWHMRDGVHSRFYPACGTFYFPRRRHQQLLVSLLKDTGKVQ